MLRCRSPNKETSVNTWIEKPLIGIVGNLIRPCKLLDGSSSWLLGRDRQEGNKRIEWRPLVNVGAAS
jgi:hypothetical protein